MSVHINCTPLNFVPRKLMTNTAQKEYLMGLYASLLCTRWDVKDFNIKFAKSILRLPTNSSVSCVASHHTISVLHQNTRMKKKVQLIKQNIFFDQLLWIQ